MFTVQHGHCRRINGKVHKSPTYQSWSCANDRCYIESHRWYEGYGGRGIGVCEQWRRGQPHAFAHFLDYLQTTIGERPSKDMTLDRIEVDKDYEPGNIKWSSKSDQRLNQRRETEPCAA